MQFLFENLSSQDFEDLIQDVMQARENKIFESFKPGKDGGIDLRLLENDGSIIVQVKHMLGSYGSKGSNHKKEFEKELKLAATRPDILSSKRYVLATSAKLSLHNKREILNYSNGLIKSESDILDLGDIENTLRSNEKIVRAHIKLWLSSSAVLEEIINRKVTGRSSNYFEYNIKPKIPLFVQTESFNKAQNILTSNKILIITGEPGIGKTTLSEFLCLSSIESGYSFFYCKNVGEIEQSYIKEEKQIFLLDDFLGSNFLEVFKGQEEKGILLLISRIKNDPNKYLILNSRTTIYERANFIGQYWDTKKLGALKYHLNIEKYSNVDKAKILYNHLRYRNLDKCYFEEVCRDNQFLKIVKHSNFNPRIIEFITSSDQMQNVTKELYLNEALKLLDNPSTIWQKSYLHQIDDDQRWLLQMLFSFPHQVEYNQLQISFTNRLIVEQKNVGEYSFKNALKGLQDGFIRHEIVKSKQNEKKYLRFINPSVFDFLKNELLQNKNSLDRIFQSIHHFSQWKFLFSIKEIKTYAEAKDIPNYIFNNLTNYNPDTLSKPEYEFINLFWGDIKEIITTEFLCEIVKNDSEKLKSNQDLFLFYHLLNYVSDEDVIKKWAVSLSSPIEFSRKWICLCDTLEDLENVVDSLSGIFEWTNIANEVFDNPDVEEKMIEIIISESEEMISNDNELHTLLQLDQINSQLFSLESELENKITALGATWSYNYSHAFGIDPVDILKENESNTFDEEIENKVSVYNSSSNEDSKIINVFKN